MNSVCTIQCENLLRNYHTVKVKICCKKFTIKLTSSFFPPLFTIFLIYHFVEGEDFHLLGQEVTFLQGATTDSTQNASIEIIDDSLVEGTESFVVSGNVTAPALFVSDGDTATITILDNDGECGYV